MRGVVVQCRETSEIKLGHLRVASRDPHHQRVHDGEIERGQCEREHMKSDAEEEEPCRQPLESGRPRLDPGEEHWSNEGQMKHVRFALDAPRRIATGPAAGHKVGASRRHGQTTAPAKASDVTMFAAPIAIAAPITICPNRLAPSSDRLNAQIAPPITNPSPARTRAVGPDRSSRSVWSGAVHGMAAPPPAAAAMATVGTLIVVSSAPSAAL